MTSYKAIRDPVADHLLTPQNAALVIIDFQPVQVASIQSRSKRELVANITALARIGKLYGLPVVLSTVNVGTGRNQPTIHQITDVLADVQPIDVQDDFAGMDILDRRKRYHEVAGILDVDDQLGQSVPDFTDGADAFVAI